MNTDLTFSSDVWGVMTPLSSPQVSGEPLPSVTQDRSANANGCANCGACSCGTTPTQRIERAYQAMTTALLHYHFTGDFIAGADYVIARRKWETAVLDSTKGDQQ